MVSLVFRESNQVLKYTWYDQGGLQSLGFLAPVAILLSVKNPLQAYTFKNFSFRALLRPIFYLM